MQFGFTNSHPDFTKGGDYMWSSSISQASLGGSQTALVFTSGGVIAAIAQSLLEFPQSRYAPFNWRLANAGISKFVCGKSGRFLATLNEHGHFEGEQSKMLTYR